MRIDAQALLVVWLAISFMARAETAPCPLRTVVINVTSSADVLHLTDAIECTGDRVFDITWYNSLDIEQKIKVSDQKSVMVTGSGSPTIRAGLKDDDDYTGANIGLGSATGVFSVHNESTLILKQLVLDGGYSEDEGAVAVTSSSSLHVYDCAFTSNNASTGGETKVKLGKIRSHHQWSDGHELLYCSTVPTFLRPLQVRCSDLPDVSQSVTCNIKLPQT